ncbi:hypothetical protein RhiirA5_497814 [Rhizophagus irregularis]|uniref:Crinkler family protein n=3 Tax=Rhizophagus irregularis TaxID=588596 RepID=A0A2N0PWS8_9GLOM|nr:hypothetical protein RhiirA5_497814 [Rhizophagus irregularis]
MEEGFRARYKKDNKNSLVNELKKVIKAEIPQTFANVDVKDIKLWKVEIPKPPKKNIHVIVEPLVSTTTSASNEILELKEQRASLQALLNMSETNEGFKWTVNIDDAVLEGLKEYIREMDKPPALENDGALQVFETPQSSSTNGSYRKCSQSVVKHLMAESELRQKTTPLDFAYEATKSIYSYCYLASGVSFYEKNFKIIPEKLITGHNGQGNLDYAIECRSINRIVGLVEVKKDDFKQGFAQMESSLNAKTTIVCKDENLQAKVLGYIVWLLEEAQKPVEASRGIESNKKHRSSSSLAEKSDIVDSS